MCRLTFAALAAIAALSPLRAASAQQMLGRDLFDFPLGTLAEAPALATAAGGGYWNPATIALTSRDRLLLSATSLNSPVEQGVSALLGTVSMRVIGPLTAGVQFAQASVNDLLRTNTDPQSIGDEIPYRSTLVSAVLSASHRGAAVGVALRRRSAQVDLDRAQATSVDVGGTIERPGGLPVRLAASTFLHSLDDAGDRVTTLGAVEAFLPVERADVRVGLAHERERGAGQETYGYASARVRAVELRGGLARHSEHGAASTRLRLGMGLRYARYLVGIAREDGTAGLGATYQFLLTTVFR